MTVGAGQQEAARAALKIARNEKEVWTQTSWKPVMKNVLKSFQTGVASHGGRTQPKVHKSSDGGDGSKPGLGVLAEAETHLPKVAVAAIGSPLGSVEKTGLPGLSTLLDQLRIGTASKFLGGGTFGKVYKIDCFNFFGRWRGTDGSSSERCAETSIWER